MNTYTVTIDSILTLPTPYPKYVVTINYTVTGTDGVHTASIKGSSMQPEGGDASSFLPYDKLTNDIVIGWVAGQNQNFVNEYANVDAQIAAMVGTPITPAVTPLPWAK